MKSDGDLRTRLIEAATAMLTEHHALAVPSLRAVARACGVTAPAIYSHFDSVDALIAAVLDNGFTALEQTMNTAEDVRRAAHAYVQWGLANPGLYQLLFESADRLGVEPAVETLTRTGVAAVEAQLGITPAEAARLHERVWVSLHGIVSLRIHKAHYAWTTPVSQDVDDLMNLFLS
ncbi:TetR/AcrR family transcriptional regulator [Winogradskya consettensis]|uniref:TetR family transcriptional regulator n=1 Tax=Winogradskya consettensis TaxID=113560 RepID=A0A919SL03_9ACTN|nr:TetR/AcrR family transcriptional regulator [Actinoplanes consettensis]GIM74715.1 TetR family transcriptional regulator [Actinoplanes consettensis]